MYFFAPSVDRAINNDNLVEISMPSIHILVSHTIFQLQKKKERKSFPVFRTDAGNIKDEYGDLNIK